MSALPLRVRARVDDDVADTQPPAKRLKYVTGKYIPPAHVTILSNIVQV